MDEEIKKTYGRNVFFQNYINKVIKKKRFEINDIFFSNIKINSKLSLLDVGTTSSNEDHQNLLIKKYPFKKKITCLSNLNLNILKKTIPNIKIKKGNGKKNNFSDNSFDIVVTTATIEHVGSNKDQLKFLKECYRVSKKILFITTPNRWFPIEMHSRLPFIHYFPKSIFRFILKIIGQNFLSKEQNLNLLTKNDLVKMLNCLKIKNYFIKKIYVFGICSNFVFIIKKKL